MRELGIAKPKEYDARVGETSFEDEFAKVFVVCYKDSGFVESNSQNLDIGNAGLTNSNVVLGACEVT